MHGASSYCLKLRLFIAVYNVYTLSSTNESPPDALKVKSVHTPKVFNGFVLSHVGLSGSNGLHRF